MLIVIKLTKKDEKQIKELSRKYPYPKGYFYKLILQKGLQQFDEKIKLDLEDFRR